jgi:catechol 2,3-dioxygenase-like lactoylglutathione lyase family enzyme
MRGAPSPWSDVERRQVLEDRRPFAGPGRVASELHVTCTVRVTSSVIFVSDLDRSIAFYRDLFACQVTIHDREAALLLAPDGFQIYLIGQGPRAPHLAGGIGPQYLIWAVDGPDDLQVLERTLRGHGGRVDTFQSGGVTFVTGRDPDNIRILMAHPAPDKLPRSIVGPHLYR